MTRARRILSLLALAGARRHSSRVLTTPSTTSCVIYPSDRQIIFLMCILCRLSCPLAISSCSRLSFLPSRQEPSPLNPSSNVSDEKRSPAGVRIRVFPSPTDAGLATRYVTRHKPRQVTVIEAEVKNVDVRSSNTCYT